ncbi:MAG: DDE-type integrase/transposase/recombinase, partial [Planctomycetes bacterium]|nr:DDE-type integrase/transposase/recombinase [Planctomycetota bacterium]
MLDQLQRRHPEWELPSVSTVAGILAREGLVRPMRRHHRAHPGCPKAVAAGPNDIWAADYKGQFRLKNGQYCFPLTVSDLASRYVLGVDAHPTISYELTQKHFQSLFEAYGLPNRIRTDNGVPFASDALARLSQLSAWWIKLGIYPELIEPGRPSQNGIHERMHRT